MTNFQIRDIDSSKFRWTVAIFSAREQSHELIATINSILQACTEPTVIDVMVNGNIDLAEEIAGLIEMMVLSPESPVIRVWSIPLAGKAHAWNQYVHLIWPGSRLAYFVDGYARVEPNGFQLLAESMATATQALAGGGVPVSGRTANQLREHTLRVGGLHGALFVLKEAVMIEMRDRAFKLPLGLYGFDSLLGAVLAFGLDPLRNQWDIRKYVILHPDVTFTIDEKKWWRYSVIKTQFRRILNNALRTLVVRATIDFLAHRKLPPEELPRTVEEFVLKWVRNCPDEARKLQWKSPVCRLVLRKLREPRDWSAAEQAPKLVYASPFNAATATDGPQH